MKTRQCRRRHDKKLKLDYNNLFLLSQNNKILNSSVISNNLSVNVIQNNEMLISLNIYSPSKGILKKKSLIFFLVFQHIFNVSTSTFLAPCLHQFSAVVHFSGAI